MRDVYLAEWPHDAEFLLVKAVGRYRWVGILHACLARREAFCEEVAWPRPREVQSVAARFFELWDVEDPSLFRGQSGSRSSCELSRGSL